MRELTVVVPKVESPEELASVAAQLERAVRLQAVIETPAGIEAAASIARATPLLEALVLGYADLATALGRRGAERHIDRWLYHQEAVLAAHGWRSGDRRRVPAARRAARAGTGGASGARVGVRWQMGDSPGSSAGLERGVRGKRAGATLGAGASLKST
jgi:hypothetical protein